MILKPVKIQHGRTFFQIDGAGPLLEVDWHWGVTDEGDLPIIDELWQNGMPVDQTKQLIEAVRLAVIRNEAN